MAKFASFKLYKRLFYFWATIFGFDLLKYLLCFATLFIYYTLHWNIYNERGNISGETMGYISQKSPSRNIQTLYQITKTDSSSHESKQNYPVYYFRMMKSDRSFVGRLEITPANVCRTLRSFMISNQSINMCMTPTSFQHWRP